MPGDGHIYADELTPANIATLDQNWSEANAALDRLLDLNRDHRQEGCAAWYCTAPEMTGLLDGYELHQAQMILRAAVERLTG
jgi:hypothetical protein